MSEFSPETSPEKVPVPGRRERLAARLRRRVRIPLGRSISVLTLLVVGGIFLVAAVGGVGLQISNRPVFCISCHEMGVHYETWRNSSHKNVGCEECHVMPGTLNMLKSKATSLRQIYLHQKGGVKPSIIQGHVPDANCKRCHPETRDLVVYHSLKITHKKHWDRGISCTFCHDRVVHGPRVEPLAPGKKSDEGEAGRPTKEKMVLPGGPLAYKYTPTMATCFKCHDGKKAPNNCSLCHVTLGERRPAAFNPEWVEAHKENVRQDGGSCARCHQQDFCTNCHRAANPHPDDWQSVHPAAYKKEPTTCQVCHRAPNEKARGAGMAFCYSCHTLRREHKSPNWTAAHQDEFRRDPEKCSQCHTQSWCADCHQTTRSHPPFWLQTHPAQAKEKPDSCRECHVDYFCIACHKGKGPGSVPATHKSKEVWLKSHKVAVEKGAEGCSVCHEPAFCQACHKSARPATHEHRWLKLHGPQAEQDSRSCLTCHEKKYCNTCHGLDMPHASDWLDKHGRTATGNKKTCLNCHAEVFCSACHRGIVPSTHTPMQNWLSHHGETAAKNANECKACHHPQLCDACHGIDMPHPTGWKKKGHTAAAKSDADTCVRCHKSQFCNSCHGVTIPHPKDWLETHPKDPKASLKSDGVCLRCHSKKNDCAGCHGE